MQNNTELSAGIGGVDEALYTALIQTFSDKPNAPVRAAFKLFSVPQWAVADWLGISESTLTRKMRREMSESEKQEFITAIVAVDKERKQKGSL